MSEDAARGRAALYAYGQIAWSWLSLQQPRLAEAFIGSTGSIRAINSQDDGANRNSSPGRARHTPSNHSRREGRAFFGFTCVSVVLLRVHLIAQRVVGASRHPVFPAPSSQEGPEPAQSSGILCRETANARADGFEAGAAGQD